MLWIVQEHKSVIAEFIEHSRKQLVTRRPLRKMRNKVDQAMTATVTSNAFGNTRQSSTQNARHGFNQLHPSTTGRRRKTYCARAFSTLIAVGLIAGFSKPSSAGESVISAAPAGGNDLSAALLPPPGVYGGVALVPAFGEGFYDAYGNHVGSVSAKMEAYTAAAGIQYVYPFEVFGGRIASGVQGSVTRAMVKFEPGFNQGDTGIGDLSMDVFNWSRYLGRQHTDQSGTSPWSMMPLGLTVSTGLALKAPSGHYTPTQQVNTGANLWIIAPNVGFTYLTQPVAFLGDGPIEISARAYYSFPMTNSATNYRTGHVFSMDWAVAKYISPRLEIGITGTYQQQLTADDRPASYGPMQNGNRYGNAALGPVISYVLPNDWGMIKAKYLAPQFYVRNGIKSQMLVVVWGKKFY